MMNENRTCSDCNNECCGQNAICIDISEYDRLMANDERLGVLLKALSKDARLNWDKTKLRFEDNYLEPILSTIFEYLYKRWLEELKKGESND